MKEIKIVLPDGIEPEDVVISFKKKKQKEIKDQCTIKVINIEYVPCPYPVPYPYVSPFIYNEPFPISTTEILPNTQVTW